MQGPSKERTYAVIAAQVGCSPDALRRAVFVVRLTVGAALLLLAVYLAFPALVGPAACWLAVGVGFVVYVAAVRDLVRR
jgi:hypothetical protein